LSHGQSIDRHGQQIGGVPGLPTAKFASGQERDEAMAKFFTVADSPKQYDVRLEIKRNDRIHDRGSRRSYPFLAETGQFLNLFLPRCVHNWADVSASCGLADHPIFVVQFVEDRRRDQLTSGGPWLG
jgi:hypothetical protein